MKSIVALLMVAGVLAFSALAVAAVDNVAEVDSAAQVLDEGAPSSPATAELLHTVAPIGVVSAGTLTVCRALDNYCKTGLMAARQHRPAHKRMWDSVMWSYRYHGRG